MPGKFVWFFLLLIVLNDWKGWFIQCNIHNISFIKESGVDKRYRTDYSRINNDSEQTSPAIL